MEQLAPELRAAWIRNCILMAIRREIPLRHALAQRLIYPSILQQYRAGSDEAVWWLAEFRTQLLRETFNGTLRGDGLEEALRSDLWTEAYRRNPGNEHVRMQLIQNLLHWVHYRIHEFPRGVLSFDMVRTTEECDILTNELLLLRELLNEKDLDEHAPLLEKADYCYRTYREYLRNESSYPSYWAYLVATDPDRWGKAK